MPNEICILCGKETTVDINTHIDYRTGYIEGAGQLCTECYLKGDSSKLIRTTGWTHDYTFESMLDEMINYWLKKYENKN